MTVYFKNYVIQSDSLINFGRVRKEFTPLCHPPVWTAEATAYIKMYKQWQNALPKTQTCCTRQFWEENDEVFCSNSFSPGVTLPCSIRAIFSSWGSLVAISTFLKQFKCKTNRTENVIYLVWFIWLFRFLKPSWFKEDCYEYIICSTSKSYLFRDTHIT